MKIIPNTITIDPALVNRRNYFKSDERTSYPDYHLAPYTNWADNACDEFCRVLRAIRVDSRDDFVMLMHSPRFREMGPDNPSLRELGHDIFADYAVACADAVLKKEANGILDVHFGFSPRAWTALHEASIGLHIPMLIKLLESGFFNPDLRADMLGLSEIDPFPFPLRQALPLNVGLRSLRISNSFSPESSAVSLLNHFYTKRDNSLDAIRLLAVNTTELQQEFFNYAKQGNMVEVGALLMAVAYKLLPLRVSQGEDELVFNTFKEIIYFLQDKNGWSLTTSEDDKFAEWKETLRLLDIYDKIGTQLIACVGLKDTLRSGMEVAYLLQAQGFDVKKHLNKLPVQRSNNSPYKCLAMMAPKMNLHGEITKLLSVQNMYPSNWMNQECEQPSMSIEHVACSRSLVRNMCTLSASSTLQTKSLNAKHKLVSNKWLSSSMRFLTRGVRLL